MLIFMGEDKEISVVINFSEKKKKLEELEDIKVKIVITILRERYDNKVLEMQYYR